MATRRQIDKEIVERKVTGVMKRKAHHILPTNDDELSALRSNPNLKGVIHVDEAGRGPWAGPIVATALYFPTSSKLNITEWLSLRPQPKSDSKGIKEHDRRVMFDKLQRLRDAGHVYFATIIIDNNQIDKANIGVANMKVFYDAISSVIKMESVHNTLSDFEVIIDGNRIPSEFKTCGNVKAIIRADEKCVGVACASIIAKVTRDNIMLELDKEYPMYQWKKNKGYGVAMHRKYIHAFGISPYHRLSFAPMKHMISQSNITLCDPTMTETEATELLNQYDTMLTVMSAGSGMSEREISLRYW